jgi:hypothetical protein
MLDLTGPLQVPGYGLTVDGGNFVDKVMHLELAGDPAHKAVLGALAGPLMNRIVSLPADRWPSLLEALNGLATGRHVQAYFNQPTVEREIDRIGWSGRLNPLASSDYMMEVESNYGGGKSNYFLQRRYTVELTRNGSTLHHKVTIDFTNNMPYYTRDIVDYRATARLYLGQLATNTLESLRTVKYADPAPPIGTKLVDGWLPMVFCCGGTGQAKFEYDTPWSVRDRDFQQIYWQKQPGTVRDSVRVIWNDGNGHTYTVNGDLAQDRIIKLLPAGVSLTAGQAAAATLPSLSLG